VTRYVKVRAALASACVAALTAPLCLPRAARADWLVAEPVAAPEKPSVASGRLRLAYVPGGQGGFHLFVDGVRVITKSHLYLVKPGWTAALLNTDELRPVLRTFDVGAAKVLEADYEKDGAYARFRFELRPDDTLAARVSYGTSGAPAEVEYCAGCLNANPLAGQPFTAETVAGPCRGTVPVVAASDDQLKSRLTPFFTRLAIDSRLGPLTITERGVGGGDATATLNLFDARKGTQEWATRHPIFWLGIGSPSRPVAPGDNTVTITYTFGAAPNRSVEAGARKVGALAPLAAARTPYAPVQPLIPRPKEVKAGVGGPLRLSDWTRIVLPTSPVAEEQRAAAEIRAELKQFWGLAVAVVIGGKARAGDIVIGRAAVLKRDAPLKPEGYSLAVDATGARLAGYDPRGVYNAAQTFRQLLSRDAQGVYARPLAVRDWPTLARRGVHWFGGPDSWPFHRRMIDRILGPLKYNEMVYEVDYTAWESQPRLRSQYTTPKESVRKTVALARAHFIEPIPLLNTLGHAEWLFLNGQNLDICAYPPVPYAIDPENPHTYEVLFGIMDETIGLFGPIREFHIGHDEVGIFSKFPKPTSKKTETELLLQNVGTLHDWLKKKGVRTQMWGDMLLHPSEVTGGAATAPSLAEAAKRRAGIPKDVVIADWHYEPSSDFPSIAVLRRAGFPDVLAATWADPTNIRNFAGVAARDGGAGLLQTTWAGYAMSEALIKGDSFPQFVGYLLGAEHAWNGGANDPESLGYSPQDAFLALWDRRPADRMAHPGFTFDLAPVSNAALWAWSPDLATRPAVSTDFPNGLASLGGVRYKMGKPVWLAGALNPAGTWPRAVSFALGGRVVTSLEWLWGASLAAPLGTTIARVIVTYAAGQTRAVPIVYGDQIFAFSDRRASPAVHVAWRGTTPAGESVGVRSWRWENPRPTVPVARVTLTSENTEAAPVLLGLTGVR
jgi:hypothetical protein